MQRAFGIRSFRGSRWIVGRLKRPLAGIFRLRFARLRSRLAYFAANALLRRALRWLAALRWMTPLLAALSIAEIAARICSAVRSGAERICFCSLRRCVLTLRLWAARLSVCRARLPADFVLAIGDQEFIERTPARALVISVCSLRVSLFAGRRQALQPTAFVLQWARWKVASRAR